MHTSKKLRQILNIHSALAISGFVIFGLGSISSTFFVQNFGAKIYKAEMSLEEAAQFAFVRKRRA